MLRRSLWASILCFIGGSAFADEALERAAMDAVAHGLRDPGSAIFRNVETVVYQRPKGGHTAYVCGEVNAKNAYGGYVGFRLFYVAETKGGLVADIEPREREDAAVFSMMYDTLCRGVGTTGRAILH